MFLQTNLTHYFYINNIIGELGELVFAKAVIQHGYELGVDPDTFGPFMRSDVCDFYTSRLLKALLETEMKARTQRKTLVILSYIENYISRNDREKLIKIIDSLKCNVEYVWNHNLFY